MSNVIVLPQSTSAATFRAMARERHRAAVMHRLAGNDDMFFRLLEDVRKLDNEATKARLREERRAIQRWKMAQALERILAFAERQR